MKFGVIFLTTDNLVYVSGIIHFPKLELCGESTLTMYTGIPRISRTFQCSTSFRPFMVGVREHRYAKLYFASTNKGL